MLCFTFRTKTEIQKDEPTPGWGCHHSPRTVSVPLAVSVFPHKFWKDYKKKKKKIIRTVLSLNLTYNQIQMKTTIRESTQKMTLYFINDLVTAMQHCWPLWRNLLSFPWLAEPVWQHYSMMSHLKLVTKLTIFALIDPCNEKLRKWNHCTLQYVHCWRGVQRGGSQCAVIQTVVYFHVRPAHGTSTLPPHLSGAEQQDPRGAESSAPTHINCASIRVKRAVNLDCLSPFLKSYL